jgi:nicotinamidase-related amidase
VARGARRAIAPGPAPDNERRPGAAKDALQGCRSSSRRPKRRQERARGPWRIAGTGKLIQGSAETRLDPRVAPVGDEPVIVKHQVGAFSSPPLEQLLRAKNIDTLVLAGLFSSGVVLSTAEAAADLNYRLIVLSNCVADPDPEVNRVLLDKVLPTQADVIDSAQYTRTLNP